MNSCIDCIKKENCSMRNSTAKCTMWESEMKTYGTSDNDFPNRPYPNIYELEDKIKHLENRVQWLEKSNSEGVRR